MDKELVNEKLEALRHSVRRVENKRPQSADELVNDFDLQDIVTVNLTRAVQLCVDIAAHIISDTEAQPPSTMAESFDVLHQLGILDAALTERLKKAVGFRNIAVHSYQAIDWQIVHHVAQDSLDDFKEFARAIAERL